MSSWNSPGCYGSGNVVQRLRSIPIKVHWAGFESNTHRMQESGWEVSAWEDIASMMIQMGFKRGDIRGLTSRIPYDHYQAFRGTLSGGPPEVIAEIKHVGEKIWIQHVGDLPTFRPVDCTPQWTQERMTSMDVMCHFVPRATPDKEIIVAEEDVEALLQKILDKQQPAREARAKAAYYEERESGLLVPKVHAKIISLQDIKAA